MIKKTNPSKSPSNKYYRRGEVVGFEEDQTHEFKGHRNISIEEIPPWCINNSDNNRTRNAVSRNLCGFLNSGWGGTVYIGILDGGSVQGVRLTQYQQDHLSLSLQDAMNAFRPPVPHFMYNTEFIPVLEPQDKYPCQFIPVPEDVRQQPHYLRSHSFCWCDYDALGSYHNGIIPLSYVVEITVLPLNCNDPRVCALMPDFKIPTSLIFQCEDGQIYFRKHSTLIKYSFCDVEEHTREEVLLYKMPQLMEAWREWRTYSRLLQLVNEVIARQKHLHTHITNTNYGYETLKDKMQPKSG
ncbi:uncharacterized protein LOC110838558 [Zootermopsis nevadensis]|uniref:Schlafen-like protein 1 n=1 Tax=Zootermopsis nevadensis TaxID=136037 RepID=A0A067QV55_ZOONE|nr:uncharacterized protein LOC110838558 [Zootermopsis nevadensis]XP_021937549.1 uncharacterized protein LOC110838558 [Zootermopsis nevadensis]XP_021937550.1 uncharacterized protein LOC110838558 [Zootermopsis nevadensis]XP_021937551.1 uncharacterized protein LOC110838558 [Zootermopsis nevadensis]KDR09683.1 Schlafen-like protein 1 [Zootermopsis nevadensis]